MKFPESAASRVYKALLRSFKLDPILQREIKTWLLGEGERVDVEGQPTDRTRPLIKLTPMKASTMNSDSCSLRSNFEVKVEVWIGSYSYFDVMDLWGQIERVVLDPVNDLTFQDVGVTLTVPTMQQVQLIREDYSTYAQGVIAMEMWQDLVPATV